MAICSSPVPNMMICGATAQNDQGADWLHGCALK